MAEKVLMSLQDVSYGYTTETILEDINLCIYKGQKITLVGKNGSGKSTLFKILEGKTEIEFGKKFFLEGTNIVKLQQELDRGNFNSAFDMAKSLGGEDFKIKQLLYALNIDPEALADSLSGGQVRKTYLAGCFAKEPDILLLDEPTNHLDINTIEWLEKEIKKFRGSIVIISHDKRFLENASDSILWLEDKKLRFLNKSFKFFEDWQNEVYDAEIKKQNKIQQHIKQEERYALRGVTARRKRNQKRLEKLEKLKLIREQKRNPSKFKLENNEEKSISRLVFEAIKVNKFFDEKIILKDFNTKILKGDKIGIVGANGSGKSTLIKLILGKESIDSGKIRRAKTLKIAYFDQYREQLDEKKTPWEILGDGTDYINYNGKDTHVVGYLKRFLFSLDEIKSRVSTFSGGQKNRLLLSLTLAKKYNFLVLDEPTNDLDMDTLEILEDILMDFKGTLIIISHDRDFINRIATNTFVMKGDGEVIQAIGGWDDYLKKVNNKSKNYVNKKQKTLPKKKNKNINKLTLSEEKEISELEIKINKLKISIKKLNALLGDKNLYVKNPEKFNEIIKTIDKSNKLLENFEERWIKLEIKKESIKI